MEAIGDHDIIHQSLICRGPFLFKQEGMQLAYTATDATYTIFKHNHGFGGMGGARGRVYYPVKAHHSGHNLSIITETPSLSVYEPIAVQFCSGESPENWGTVPPSKIFIAIG